MKIKSFGCSFIYGSDLGDFPDCPGQEFSLSTWPALIASRLDLEYECYALPGQGNFKILSDIIAQASLDDPSVMIINWTWIDRFDYVNNQEQWDTLRPSNTREEEKFYYRNLHSQYHDMLSSAYHVNSAIDFLTESCYPFVMTYMDYNLLSTVDPNWHDPRCLEVIQQKISKHLTNFNGDNLIDWSKKQGFPISSTLHPLNDAHSAAADFMQHRVESILTS